VGFEASLQRTMVVTGLLETDPDPGGVALCLGARQRHGEVLESLFV
jgi:hypothetical protein